MYMMIMIQCHAYYMPKEIYHLISRPMQLLLYLLPSAKSPRTSRVVPVWVGLPHVVHGFQAQFNTNECSGLSLVLALPVYPISLSPSIHR